MGFAYTGVRFIWKTCLRIGMCFRSIDHRDFAAQHMLALPGLLAHHVVVWACRWLALPEGRQCGVLRMVRDVFHLSGLLRFDPFSRVSEMGLNQHAHRAHGLICPLRERLSPFSIVVILGET